METNATMVGAWTTYHPLTPADEKVWKEVMGNGDLAGTHYTPKEVATQLVNGTNYRFKCTAQHPPMMVIWEAVVEIYAPIEGKPHLVGNSRI